MTNDSLKSSKTNGHGNTSNDNINNNTNNTSNKPNDKIDGKSSDIDPNDVTNTNDNVQITHGFILPTLLNNSLIVNFLENYKENNTIFRSSWQFGCCIIVLYLTDGPSHLFFPALKQYNRDFFIFLHLILLAISVLTIKKNTHPKGGQLLDRFQTEEWKGIMQIVFVMYHYFDAAEVYNLIRVFIAAYVWMTGFGNTCYFLKRNDYGFSRLFGMFFRLNWLVFWTCLMLNQQLMLYYICPLHTFFFLMCYVTWGIFNEYNKNTYVVWIKLFAVLIFLVIMFEISVSVFEASWFWLRWLLEFHGTLYEWHFRTTLDHYATWLGMVFAVNFKYVAQFWNFMESRPNIYETIKWKGLVFVLTMISLIIWYNTIYIKEKSDYNYIHPYTSWVPIFSYIIIRNLYKPSRVWYSRFLEWMGQITLETYIFQYHLFMIDDAKSILVMIEGYPLVNFVLVSIIYVLISRVAFNATNTLRNYLYPPTPIENLQVIIQTLKYCLFIVCLYALAYVIWMFNV